MIQRLGAAVVLCCAAGPPIMSWMDLLFVTPSPDTCCLMLAEQGLQIIAVHMAY